MGASDDGVSFMEMKDVLCKIANNVLLQSYITGEASEKNADVCAGL